MLKEFTFKQLADMARQAADNRQFARSAELWELAALKAYEPLAQIYRRKAIAFRAIEAGRVR